jgi:hypothetical protein
VWQALTFGIVLALCGSLGSIIPLLTFHSNEAGTAVGIYNWVALVVSVVGIVGLSYAGALRDRAASQRALRVAENRDDMEAMLPAASKAPAAVELKGSFSTGVLM